MKKVLLIANVSKEHVRKFHLPFIRMLQSEGWQVDVACRMDEPIPECDHAFDLPCDRNPFKGNLLKTVRILEQIIRDNEYDVIHCNTVTGGLIGRLAVLRDKNNRPKVFYTNHGLHFYPKSSLMRWIVGYPMEKILAHLTDVFIAVNELDYKMAKQYLSGCGVIERVCGPGVNLNHFRTFRMTDMLRHEYRRSINISPEDFVLIYVAEISRNKNQKKLLDVFDRVRQKIPSAKLLLVGSEHDHGKLCRFVHNHKLDDYIIFLGWRDDIAELLSISDVFVASSRSEGLGVSVIEAMAAGLPVVAFKNRGHSEIIEHGENGFLIEQGNCEEMARCCITLYRDKILKRKLVEQGHKSIEKYDVKTVLDDMKAIYLKYGQPI